MGNGMEAFRRFHRWYGKQTDLGLAELRQKVLRPMQDKREEDTARCIEEWQESSMELRRVDPDYVESPDAFQTAAPSIDQPLDRLPLTRQSRCIGVFDPRRDGGDDATGGDEADQLVDVAVGIVASKRPAIDPKDLFNAQSQSKLPFDLLPCPTGIAGGGQET